VLRVEHFRRAKDGDVGEEGTAQARPLALCLSESTARPGKWHGAGPAKFLAHLAVIELEATDKTPTGAMP
jgi:hypothetical protein